MEKTRGIILRTQRYSETSLILRWLTTDFGRVSTIAKGARRPKSPFAGKLDLFIEAQLAFNRSARSDLHTLREVMVNDFHLPLRQDMDRLHVASYAVALIEQTTESETPIPEVYDLLDTLLEVLAGAAGRPRLIFAFELKLLEILGLAPSATATSLTPAVATLLCALKDMKWAEIEDLTPKAAQVNELARFLQGFLVYHLGRVPKLRGTALKGFDH